MAELDLGRIKRNVGKMVSQGAPETEIDAYISGEGTTIDAVKAFKPQTPDVTTDIAKGFSSGANTGIDATLNMVGAPIRAPVNYIANQLGYEGELIPELQAARRFNVAGGGEGMAGRAAEAVGEVAGGSLLPFGGMAAAGRAAGPAASGILGQYARKPGAAAGLDALSAGGAGAGVAVAREGELGPAGEIGLGLLGGFAAPNAANVAARTYGGVRSGVKYGNEQIQRAKNPEQAAYRDIADQMVKANLDPAAVQKEVVPAPSSQLAKRQFSDDDITDIISRSLAGDSAEDIAKAHKLAPSTVRRYVEKYKADNPTPRNVIDIGKELKGSGGAQPLSNQARADMAIADDPIAAQRLIGRQREQPGRTADIIEQSGIEGRNIEQELDRLKGVAKVEENAAYGTARRNAAPINIRSVIRAARARHPQDGGKISEQMNRAVDLFFEAGYVPGKKDNLRYTRKMGVINDVPNFLRRRHELDQMIADSKKDGKSTPLTAELTEFRKRVNDAARRNNPALKDADQRFSENRTVERLISQGEDLGKKLTPKTRKGLREFRNLTETQQEVVRTAFEGKMAAEALGTRRGRAAADQFGTDAFDKIVATIYPKSAGKEVYQRGQRLLRDLKREAISTETTRDVLAGSRTAPLQDDMAELLEGPRAAADLATGRFAQVLENISNRLTRQIGKRAAEERVRILTETDPAKMLAMLRRLGREAKTAGERQAYAAAIKEFAGTGRKVGPVVSTGIATAASEE